MNELTLTTPPPGLTTADYAMIEQAVMETARGRWFLLEYARRQRAAETQRLADAVDRLEALIAGASRGEASGDASAATIAERLSDIVWRMREAGFDDKLCAELERQIYGVRRLRGDGEARMAETTRALEPPAAIEAAPVVENGLAELAPSIEIETITTAPQPPETPAATHALRLAALSHLDDLPLSDRLALFC